MTALTCSACAAPLDSRASFCPNCGASVTDPLLGAALHERFLVEKRIAIGGFGSVYRGRDLDAGQPVAIKVMHRELAGDEPLVARFRREGAVLRLLRDPHAVATFAHGETVDGLPFLVMELLEGETLLDLMRRRGPLPWRDVFALAVGVCRALAEAHGHGVVHRDLKPSNIFVTTSGRPKVLDFGIAKILESSDVRDPRELTMLGTAVGSVDYMAPEQLMGGKAEPRSDLYVLGLVLFEAIAGRRPFRGSGLDLLTDQLGVAPMSASELAEVPRVVDSVLLRCLAPDVDDRFPDATELAGALDAALRTQVEP
jgi:serine/threonine protein kinase